MRYCAAHSRRSLARWVLAALPILTTACGDDLVGPAAESCGSAPLFTVLPVAISDINGIVVVGGLGAPGHTLPTAHAGFYLRTVGAQVVAPGNMQITRLRRVRYLTSPNRQGVEAKALGSRDRGCGVGIQTATEKNDRICHE